MIFDGVVPGLNDFVAEDGTVLHPPVARRCSSPSASWSASVSPCSSVVLGGRMDDLAAWRHQPADGLCAGADGAVGLGGNACRLVHHRDRPSALAGQWRAQDIADAVAALPATSVGDTLAAYLLVYAGLIAAYLSVIMALALKAAKTGA
jgi:cytochrome d ubiquinol oxidase subunit I